MVNPAVDEGAVQASACIRDEQVLGLEGPFFDVLYYA